VTANVVQVTVCRSVYAVGWLYLHVVSI